MATSEEDLKAGMHETIPPTIIPDTDGEEALKAEVQEAMPQQPLPDIDRATIKKSLEAMGIPTDKIDMLFNTDVPPESGVSALDGIVMAEARLSQVAESVKKILAGLKTNPSIISQLSVAWSEWSLTKRILGGAVAFVPLTVGLAANIGFLSVLSGVSLVGYSAGGFLLDDLDFYTKAGHAQIEQEMIRMGNALEYAIGALENLRRKFDEELKRFKRQNDALQTNVCALNEKIQELGYDIANLTAAAKFMSEHAAQLKIEIALLEEHKEQNKEALAAAAIQLTHMEEGYLECHAKLTKQNAAFLQAKTDMSQEIGELRSVSTALRTVVTTLMAKEKQDQHELVGAINAQTEAFQKNFGETRAELARVREELKVCQEQYKAFLESAQNQAEAQETALKPAQLMKRWGFMADLEEASENPSTLYNSKLASVRC